MAKGKLEHFWLQGALFFDKLIHHFLAPVLDVVSVRSAQRVPNALEFGLEVDEGVKNVLGRIYVGHTHGAFADALENLRLIHYDLALDFHFPLRCNF